MTSASTPSKDYTTIQLSLSDGIAKLALNRPEAANAINGQMAAELFDAANTLRWDDTVRVVLLTASGKVFCGGGDIAEFGALGDAPTRARRPSDPRSAWRDGRLRRDGRAAGRRHRRIGRRSRTQLGVRGGYW